MDGKSWSAATAEGAWQSFAALPLSLQWFFVGLLGLVIGSFLTVVIHRLPIMMARAWEAEHDLDMSSPPHANAEIKDTSRADTSANAPANTSTAAQADAMVDARIDAADASTGKRVTDITTDKPADVEADAAADQRFDLALPRSHCPQCGHTLTWYENLPLLSYLLSRGRCRACGTPIGAFYPAIEAATMLLALLAFWRFGAHWQALAGFGLLSALLVLACIDARTQFLPDAITLPLLWAGLLLNLPIWDAHSIGAVAPGLFAPGGNDATAAGLPGHGVWLQDPGTTLSTMPVGLFSPLSDAVIGAAAGYGFLWVVYWGFRLIRGKEGIGYGDFKLLAALGAWFGWTALPQMILVAALSGSVIGVIGLVSGRFARDEPLPFGPYLAIAGAVTLLFGEQMRSAFVPWLAGF